MGGYTTSYTSEVWALNLTSYTWRQINTSGTTSTLTQIYHTATLHDNMMVVYGGWGTGGMWSGSNQLRALDLRTSTWIKINASAPQPVARYDHSAISYNRKMVVFGGSNDNSYPMMAWTLDVSPLLDPIPHTTTVAPTTSTTTVAPTTSTTTVAPLTSTTATPTTNRTKTKNQLSYGFTNAPEFFSLLHILILFLHI